MEPQPKNRNERKRAAIRIAEDVFVLLCIPVLWPTIMGWQAPIYAFIRYVALAGLLWIFIRRLRAIRAHGPDRSDIEAN